MKYIIIFASLLLIVQVAPSAGKAGSSGGTSVGGSLTNAASAALTGNPFAATLAETGNMLISSFGKGLAPSVENFAQELGNWVVNALFHHEVVHTIVGRRVAVNVTGNTVMIRDYFTGVVVAGTGDNLSNAMAAATSNFISTMYNQHYISIHDLHLAPVVTTPEPLCGDVYSKSYCENAKRTGQCSSPLYARFVVANCRFTCTNCA